MESYESIKEWKQENLYSQQMDNDSLNAFHDRVKLRVLEVAKSKVAPGDAPCRYTWFITGSGGRYEQGVISDQDHGIIYEIASMENDCYFKKLGEELSYGLDVVDYPYCSGKIMSSNTVWRKSLQEWECQLHGWMEDGCWEAIRYLQIFYDARPLTGEHNVIAHLKASIYRYHLDYPSLIGRIADNIRYYKNIINPIGRLMVEQHGIRRGCANIKYAAFLPYVNAVRLLSIKEGVCQTSTLERIKALEEIGNYHELLRGCGENFSALLAYRFSFNGKNGYDDTHYLNLASLTKAQRKELKRIIKEGKKLHDEVIAMAETMR